MNAVNTGPTHLSGDASGVAPERFHYGYLDGLRALAAIFVVLHHSYLQVNFSNAPLPHIVRLILRVFIWGHDAVDLFIVLSGFCLMLPIIRSDGRLPGGSWLFFKKRARRILPPYYFAMGLSLLLITILIGHKTGTLWDVSVPVTKFGILTHLILVQDAFHSTRAQINHAFWSISVEWRIYFAFPILIFCWSRFGAVKTTLITVLLSYIMLGVLSKTLINTETDGVTPQYLGLFVLGMMGAQFSFGREWSVRYRFLRLIVPSAFLLINICGGFV